MEKGQIIELDNGKKYAIAETVEVDNNKYIYIINLLDNKEIHFAQFDNEEISFVEDEELYRALMFEVVKKTTTLNHEVL